MVEHTSPTRRRLVEAAADLISASPGQDVPLRAICDAAGVKLPTLYHYFGSKSGLLDAVVNHGFDLYLEVKGRGESTGDVIQDLREGWDAHVRFGLSNPAFYALMYGQVSPGRRPGAQSRPTALLRGLTSIAAAEGRLVVSAVDAADQILAANVGVTLFLITSVSPDLDLSARVREAILGTITGEESHARERSPVNEAARGLLRELAHVDTDLGSPEVDLLVKWVRQLADAP